MTDEELESRLLTRLWARDERAFNELVKAYQERVFSLIFRMLGHRSEAEDLSQEVFVQVFKAIDSFRGDSKLSTWIYRIAVNLCKNRAKYLSVRKTSSQQELDETTAPASSAGPSGRVERPDHLLEGRQVEQIVRESILLLEESFRECLILRDVEELSYEEVGEITGLPAGTVKSRIFRARAELRRLVEERLGEKIG